MRLTYPQTMLWALPALLLLGMLTVSRSAGAGSLSWRGIWVPPNDFSTKAAADRFLERAAQAKLNVLLPNVLAHGGAFFDTDHYPYYVQPRKVKDFDALGYLTEQAHRRGMQVHPWFCVYYEGGGDMASVHRDWSVQDCYSHPFSEQLFLDPAIPEVNPYLASVILDMLKYPVDGIHLDYIRYPGNAFGYGDVACERYMREDGVDPRDLVLHPEKVDPKGFNSFPVYALTNREVTLAKQYLLNAQEIYLAKVRVRPKLIEVQDIAQLATPSALIVTTAYPISDEGVSALRSYVERGGSLIYISDGLPPVPEGPDRAALCHLLGVTNQNAADHLRIGQVEVLDRTAHPGPREERWAVRGRPFVSATTAQVVARFEDGSPLVLRRREGKGYALTYNFGNVPAGSLAESWLRDDLSWLAKQAGTTYRGQRLAEAMRRWTQWRADRVTELVREVKQAARKQGVPVSAAGGASVAEWWAVMRDGARWLRGGWTDFLIPMLYTDSLDSLELSLAENKRGAGARWGHLCPGLSIYTKDAQGKAVSKQPEVVREQVRLVRQCGFSGICFFSSYQLDDALLKVMGEEFRGDPQAAPK